MKHRSSHATLLLAFLLLASGCGDPVPEPAPEPVVPSDGRPWRPPPPPEHLPQNRPLRAAFLLLPGVFNTELTAAYDLLQHSPTHVAPRPGIEVFTVGKSRRPVVTYEGLTIIPDKTIKTAGPIDILIVPSADESRGTDLDDPAVIGFVRLAGQKAHFVVSFCWGAFVLAQAGLLDGKQATTFPPDIDKLQSRFPKLTAVKGASFVHDGKLITSRGGVESFVSALYLLEHIYGLEAAKKISAGLLIPWPELKLPARVVE